MPLLAPGKETSLLRIPVLLPLFFQKHVDSQQKYADADGRVGDVEGRVMVLVPVDIDEIDHLPEPHPVDEITQRAGKNERKADGGELLVRPELRQRPRQLPPWQPVRRG